MLYNFLFFGTCLIVAESIADVKTGTSCEGQTLNLLCSTGETILVKTANYGRTDGHICLHSQIHNRNCYAASSLGIVSQMCNNKKSCSIASTNGIFGDPCVGTYKYLSVQYECVPVGQCKENEFQCNSGKCISDFLVSNGIRDCSNGEDEQGQDYTSAYACEGQVLNLNCRSDEVLSIINANYGRMMSSICSHNLMKNQNCQASKSLQIVQERCNDKGFCSIPSNNQVFGDPCEGTFKYTEVHYECVKKPMCTQYQFQCIHGHCIDGNLQCDGKWDCAAGEDEITCSYLTIIACENSVLNIECKRDHVIKIVGANYGRQQTHICTYQTNVNCFAPISKKKMEDRCNGKQACSISANNNEFGDPCYGTIKYLSVNYYCVNSKENLL